MNNVFLLMLPWAAAVSAQPASVGELVVEGKFLSLRLGSALPDITFGNWRSSIKKRNIPFRGTGTSDGGTWGVPDREVRG